jgi:hypothetical protein
VLTDTTSRVSNFAPAAVNDPSLRLPDEGVKLLEPIYRIATMDLMIDSESPPQTWEEMVSPARLLKYGSPFIGFFFQQNSQSEDRERFGRNDEDCPEESTLHDKRSPC